MSPMNSLAGRRRQPATSTLMDFDCDHMVAQALPAETAAVIRKALG